MHHSMIRRITLGVRIAAGMAALGACSDDQGTVPLTPPEVPTVISASGDITAKVDEFRALLGAPSNGGTAGEQAAGRREINWDGAGANPFNNQDDFPASFFNTNVKSGAVFTTPGTGFRNDDQEFAGVNAAYPDQFAAFSPAKIFSPIGSNVLDVHFQVAGQPSPARVIGFGAVFSDVDVANGTTIEFFDASGESLGFVAAPVRSDLGGQSFVGARFAEPIVARVRLTFGTGALGAAVNDVSAGGTVDLVVGDNWIYGEPRRIQ
jgi:hypothetical protein